MIKHIKRIKGPTAVPHHDHDTSGAVLFAQLLGNSKKIYNRNACLSSKTNTGECNRSG